MTKKPFSVILLAVLGLGPAAFAQATNSLAGSSMPLGDELASARSAALASAFVAVADDGAALFTNPAGLGSLTGGELSLHHQVWMADTSLDTLLISLPLPSWGGLGLAANYVNFGSFEGRDPSGTPQPSFSADRLVLEGGWGFAWSGAFSSGVGLRVAQQNLAGDHYLAATAQLGLLFHAFTDLNLGAALDGLGASGSQGNSPLALAVGAAFAPRPSRDWRMVAALSGAFESGGMNRLRAGVEAVFQGAYALRTGYEMDLMNDQFGGLAGLTLGAGYRLGSLSLDYAFLPMGDVGTSHRISLSYRFQAGTPSGETGDHPVRKAIAGGPLTAAGLARDTGTASSPGWTSSSPVQGNGTPIPPGSMTLPSPSPVSISPSVPSAGPSMGASPEPVAGGQNQRLSMSVEEEPSSPNGEGGDIEFTVAPDALKQARSLEDQGRYLEAVQAYNQIISKSPQNAGAWWRLGNCYVRLGRKDYALRCFERVLKIKPEVASLREWLEKYRSAPTPPPLLSP